MDCCNLEKVKEQSHIIQILKYVKNLGSIGASAMFTLSTVISLLSSHSSNGDPLLPRILLFNCCIMMTLSEVCGLFEKGWTPSRYNIVLFLVSLAGCFTMGSATFKDQTFNQGSKYMIGSFLLSLLYELKIIKLLVPTNRIKIERNRFLNYLANCCSFIMFFLAALTIESRLEGPEDRVISSALNVFSGLLMGFSIFYTLNRSEHDGYKSVLMGLQEDEDIQ